MFLPIAKYLVIAVLGLIVQIAFIVVESKKKYLPAVILKGCASALFVLFGFLCARTSAPSQLTKLVPIGLLLGALGDILLNLRFLFQKNGQTVFLLGVAAFLAGHVLYLVAFITVSEHVLVCLLIGLALAALLLWRIFHTLGKIQASYKIFGIVYIGVISLMTAVAAGNCIAGTQSPAGCLLFFIGAALFLVSDVIMILNTFGAEQKQALRTANLILYYLGQLCIGLSLFFF